HTDSLDLHSVPTRRSSDLIRSMVINRINLFAKLLISCLSGDSSLIRSANCFLIFGMVTLPVNPVKAITIIPQSIQKGHPNHRKRSEEHTSELQSRENLVCR